MKTGAAVLLVALVSLGAQADVTVDCDAGDSLARALNNATSRPDSVIHVRGTCTGSFVVAAEGVSLQGDPDGQTVIQAPENAIADRIAALDVVGERFAMSHLTVREAWIGVHVRTGRHRLAVILDSAFEENFGGVVVDSGSDGSIMNSTFQSNEVGVVVQFGSRGSIIDCQIVDSGQIGVDVFDHSTAGLLGTSVTGSGGVGISALIGSSLGFGEGALAENGELHAIAQDRSRLQIGPNATFGSDGDSTLFSLLVDDVSLLRSFSQVELWGDALGVGASHLSLGDIVLHGSLLTDEFTRTNLSGTSIDGVVECQTGADVFCATGTTASVSGCRSAGPPCTNASAAAESFVSRTPASMDRFERLRAPAPSELRSFHP